MISKRIVSAFIFFAAFTGLVAVFYPLSDVSAREFGLRVEGAWYGSFQPDGYPSFTFLASLDRDGNVSTSDGSDFFGGYQSATHGAWVRTGGRGIAMTLLALNFDAAGNFFAVSRTRANGELSNSGELSGAFITEYFLPGQDPLDPQAVPYQSVSSTFTAKRVQPL